MILYHAFFLHFFPQSSESIHLNVGATHGTASLHSLTTWDMVSRASAARFLAAMLMEFLGWRNIQHPKAEKNEMMISPGWYDMILYVISIYIYTYIWIWWYVIWYSPCLFQPPRNNAQKTNNSSPRGWDSTCGERAAGGCLLEAVLQIPGEATARPWWWSTGFRISGLIMAQDFQRN